MEAGLQKFLEHGVRSYGDAAAAVSLFENCLRTELMRVLDAVSCPPFRPGRTGSRYTVGGDDSDGWWIYAMREGTIGRASAELELGVWWGAPGTTAAVLYADFYEGPSWASSFEYVNRAGVQALTYDERTHLYLPVDRWASIGPGARLLAGELGRVVSKAARSAKPRRRGRKKH